MRKGVSCDDRVTHDEKIACLSRANDVIRCPNVRETGAVDKVNEVA